MYPSNASAKCTGANRRLTWMNSSRTAAASAGKKARIRISLAMEAAPLFRPDRRVLQAVVVIGLAQGAVRRGFRHEPGNERQRLGMTERDGDGRHRFLEGLVQHLRARDLLRHL